MEVQLPHLAPLKFVKEILSCDENEARVVVEFDEIPSLAMLIESAAQSSSALEQTREIKNAFLVSMKNVKLLHEPLVKIFEVSVKNKHSLENMKLIDFDVFEGEKIIANGSLTLAIEDKND